MAKRSGEFEIFLYRMSIGSMMSIEEIGRKIYGVL
jgi:hypothetical protein